MSKKSQFIEMPEKMHKGLEAEGVLRGTIMTGELTEVASEDRRVALDPTNREWVPNIKEIAHRSGLDVEFIGRALKTAREKNPNE